MPEDTTPAPAPAPEAPAEAAPATPDYGSQLKELSERLEGVESKNEELINRNEVLQDSLDTALEEMVLRSKNPEADPFDEEPGVTPAEPVPAVAPVRPTNPPSIEVEREIERSIKEDSESRNELTTQLEGLLTREAMRDLENEVKSAMTEFPKASENEILMAIEDGSSLSVKEIAEASHLNRTSELEQLKAESIEEYKAQLAKEEEGGISVPQSPGTPVTPKAPNLPGTPNPSMAGSADEEWGGALDRAKVER